MVVATAITSFVRLAHSLVSHYQIFRSVYPTSSSDDAPLLRKLNWALTFHGEALLLVTLTLIFSAVGLWLRRVLGFVISLIALLCLVAVYLLWYRLTQSVMERYGARDFSEMSAEHQYLLPLYGATWWDLVVLGIAIMVFIWQIVMLKRILKSVATISDNQSTAKSGLSSADAP